MKSSTGLVFKEQGVFAKHNSVSPNPREPFLNSYYVKQLLLRDIRKKYIISMLLYEVESEDYKAEILQ